MQKKLIGSLPWVDFFLSILDSTVVWTSEGAKENPEARSGASQLELPRY